MRPLLGLLLLVGSVPAWPPALHAETLPAPFCRLMLQEESIELQDAELEVKLARSAFQYLQFFKHGFSFRCQCR